MDCNTVGPEGIDVANGVASRAVSLGDDSPQIFLQHRIKLELSGLTPETIQAAGIRSSGDVTEIAGFLNRKSVPRAWGSCLIFPYHDESGAVVLTRVRPDNPPITAKTGKAAKYIQPSGVPTRLYVPAPTFAVLADPTARLVITEGELKTLCATQHGFHCVGLCGVDCWHAKKQTTLSPDLHRIKWRGRPVFIAFDSDAIENENVSRNERELAAVLKSHGAVVKIVRIPPGADGEKMGIDDFIFRRGAAEFQKLLEQASDPEAPDAGDLKDSTKNLLPEVEASHILDLCKLGELPRLRFWRGSWWWWSTGRYGEKPPEEVRGEVAGRIAERWLDVKSRVVTDVIDQLKSKAMLPSSIEPPAWLGAAPHGWPADECLATKNAVVHLPSLVERRELNQVAASPALLTTTATDFTLDLEARRPNAWLAFLDSLWGDDPESIESLQEWFGYLLTHDTRQQKMLLLVGPKRSGKGTIARVLTALVGKDNVAAPTLGGLATNFGLWPLIGKSVAIISDARLSGRADQAAVVERLLSISGEDSITVDRKNLAPITLRLPTRFVILTNELPKLTDASGAIVSRVVLLHTNQSFYGREDHDLTDKLLVELPGILLWAIEGWRRLRARGRFVQPDSGVESISEMDDLASPVSAFVRDCCVVERMACATVPNLFAAWERWCRGQGREKFIGTVAGLGRDLLAAQPGVRRKRVRDGEERVRIYEGIGLRDGF